MAEKWENYRRYWEICHIFLMYSFLDTAMGTDTSEETLFLDLLYENYMYIFKRKINSIMHHTIGKNIYIYIFLKI